MKKIYDAFLSHNSKDKALIEELAIWLEDEAEMKVFLDKWDLIPGESLQEALEKALNQSKCCVVFLGNAGLGNWHNEEMRSAIDERISNKSIRVVPVLLPGISTPNKENLPRFLKRLTWVEFDNDLKEEEARHRLKCGILGIPPKRR